MITGIKCCVCGKFCQPVDSSTPFGCGIDIEPPDPEFYCARCVEKEKKYYIEQGWLPSHWRKAKWESEVAKILGYVLISPIGASWSVWHKEAEALPSGYDQRQAEGDV